VDLPAAIFPQKNINFAEFLWRILDKSITAHQQGPDCVG